MIDCYRKEGVNHYDNCKEVCQAYYNVVIKRDVGQVHPNWEDKSKHEGWWRGHDFSMIGVGYDLENGGNGWNGCYRVSLEW